MEKIIFVLGFLYFILFFNEYDYRMWLVVSNGFFNSFFKFLVLYVINKWVKSWVIEFC